MAKEKKVCIRDTPKFTSSSDEESSDDEVDYTDLFKGLDRTKVDKINELIDALNKKNRLLEKQEDILYEEHEKFISVQKSLALEIKRNEMLSSELSTCHESISSLKNLNDDLNATLEKVNATSSCVEHVVICNRCKNVDFDEHVATIAKLNNDVASLNDQLKTYKYDYEKLKFSRDAYIFGRHPSIKDGLGFRKETKNLTSQRTSNLNKGKGKAPMASSSYSIHDQKNHAYLYAHVKKVSHHDKSYNYAALPIFMIHMFCLHRALLMLIVEIGLGVIMLCLMRLGKHAIVLLLFIMHVMLLLNSRAKMQKWLLENWDLNARETRLAFGFQKLL
jgi:hypothetical protein